MIGSIVGWARGVLGLERPQVVQSFEAPAEVWSEVRALREFACADSDAEVVRKALSLLRLQERTVNAGGRMVVEDARGRVRPVGTPAQVKAAAVWY